MASRMPATWTPRQKQGAIAALLIMLAVAIGIILARSATGGFKTGYALPTSGSEAPPQPVGPLPPPVGRPAPRVIAPPPVAPPVAAPVADPVDAAPAVDPDDADRIAGAIERTTLKALRRGETVRWHKAGEEGSVSVSEPRDDGVRICRNVTAIIFTDDGQTQSRSHLWCATDEDGDDWAPAR